MTQCSNFICSLRDKFMGNIAFETRIYNSLHDGRVIYFLAFIQIISTWVSSRVVMPKVLVVVSNGANDIALVNLHVVDVKEELEIFASNALA